MAFFSAGLPGIALAAVLWLTISEPKRGAMAESFIPEPLGPTLRFCAPCLRMRKRMLAAASGNWS